MNSITALRDLINSLEDPASDIDINDLDSLVSQMGQSYKHIPSVIVLLKMIQSLATYLVSKRDAAHADALPILKAFTDQLEKIENSPSLEKSEIDKIVSEQLGEFKLFQNKITSNPDIDIHDMEEIKAVILAIDWEISEETIQSFDAAVSELLRKLKPYKIHYTFLRMIHSLGKYIGFQKVNAPTDSISFLRSVFDHLQDIIQKKEISFEEKKKILEKDLSRFNDFKQRISSSGKKSENYKIRKIEKDDSVKPALSHIESSSIQPDAEQMSLTHLSEEEALMQDFDDSESSAAAPALSDKDSADSQKDVMDDLFSVKESPADELLDAIHLMEIQGNGDPSGQAMQMFEADDEPQSDGVKKFITQRNDSTPIAEIDSRLDEFFSLDSPTESISDLSETEISDDKSDADASDISQDFVDDNLIVPFKAGDEVYVESDSKDVDQDHLQDSSGEQTLKRLQLSILNKEWHTDKSLRNLIHKDIVHLKTVWENESQKLSLLDIILDNLNTVLEERSQDTLADTDLSDEPDPHPDSSAQKKGFWTKIKSNFKS